MHGALIIDKTGCLCTALHKRKCPGSFQTHTSVEEPERALGPVCLHPQKGPKTATASEERMWSSRRVLGLWEGGSIPQKRMWTEACVLFGGGEEGRRRWTLSLMCLLSMDAKK